MRRIVAVGLLSLSLLGACGGGAQDTGGRRPRTRVVTSFYPLEYVASAVAEGKAAVSNLTPAGAEPHNLELTSRQVRGAGSADLLIYLGKGFQPAVQALAQKAEGEVLDASALGQPAARGNDPHVWLDPVLMVALTNSVADALVRVDGRNARAYKRNAARFVKALNDLDDRFQVGLTRCERREFVTSHDAFGYLAQRYNLEQIAIAGIDPEQEPSAKRLAEITALVRRRSVTTIFFESLLPADLARTVARETGAKTAQLNPIESPPAGRDYLSAMRANLDALRQALNCR